MSRAKPLRDEELHRVIEPPAVAVEELDRRVEQRREEKGEEQQAEERGGEAAEAGHRFARRPHLGPQTLAGSARRAMTRVTEERMPPQVSAEGLTKVYRVGFFA